jgi:hypothetical protein
MRPFSLLIVLCFAFLLPACGGGSSTPKSKDQADPKEKPTAKDLLLGKWSAKEGGPQIILEFTRDGKVTMQPILTEAELKMAGLKEAPRDEGTYKVVEDRFLEVTRKGPGGEDRTEKNEFTVTADTLTIKDQDMETVFTRLKS